MTIKWYAFGNVGRDKNDDKSSTELDLRALRALKRSIPEKSTAVFLCEINEGDDNNEYEAVRSVFKNWRLYFRKTREPILLSPDQPPATGYINWVEDTAVAKWSPRRSVNVLKLADEKHALMTCHPAAGANGQGDRPEHARGPLQTSFDNVIQRRNEVKSRLFKNGWNVTELSDLNSFNKGMLVSRERVVWRDRTDWGLILPASGYRGHFHYVKSVNFSIDSHNGHIMRGTYRKVL